MPSKILSVVERGNDCDLMNFQFRSVISNCCIIVSMEDGIGKLEHTF